MSEKPKQPPRIMRLDEVKNVTGLSRSSIYAYIQNGAFPATIPLGARAVGWLEHEISAWIEQRTTQRGSAK